MHDTIPPLCVMYEHDIVETYNQLTLDGTMTVHVAEHMALHSMDFLLYLTAIGHLCGTHG